MTLPPVGLRDGTYKDSTPELHVGNSAFEDWFQQQPYALVAGVKQMCRDSYAAGMGDPLVTYAHPLNLEEPSGDEGFVAQIATMPLINLLQLVIHNPEYLSDSYYWEFRHAIHKRYDELVIGP